jgi:hypothetical protein
MDGETMNGLEIHAVENEARVYDLDAAARLGCARPVSIRDLIKRHRSALEALGVIRTVRKTADFLGGRPAVEFFLNRAQALFIVTKADTAEAIAATGPALRRSEPVTPVNASS